MSSRPPDGIGDAATGHGEQIDAIRSAPTEQASSAQGARSTHDAEAHGERGDVLAGANRTASALEALRLFVQAETWLESRHVIEARPELLETETIQLLAQLSEEAATRGDAAQQRLLDEHRALLERCHAIGVSSAFIEMLGEATDESVDSDDSTDGIDVPPAFEHDLDRAVHLQQQMDASPDDGTADALIAAWKAILDRSDGQDHAPFRDAVSGELALALMARFQLHERRADLDRAIAMFRRLLDASPEHPSAQSRWRNNLGLALDTRFQLLGELPDLHAAITTYAGALADAVEGSPLWASLQNNLANARLRRFETVGQAADLDAAISAQSAVLATVDERVPGWASWQNNLAGALVRRFETFGNAADLDAAIASYERALTRARPDSVERVRWQSNLATAKVSRFETFGQIADLDDAIASYRHAADAFPAHGFIQAGIQGNLGLALRLRFTATGNAVDLREAIAAQRNALRIVDAGAPVWISAQDNLGLTLLCAFETFGKPADLDAAIEAHANASLHALTGSSDWVRIQTNLAIARRVRYTSRGEIDDVDTAIYVLERTLEALDPRGPGWAACIGELGTVLRMRFQALGRATDLDRSIVAIQQAVGATPAGSPTWASRQNDLGIALFYRFEAHGRVEDLDLALIAYGEALTSVREGSSDWASGHNNQGIALRTRFDMLGQDADLDEAVGAFRQALAVSAVGSEAWGSLQHNLGNSLRRRYNVGQQPADLDDAIAAFRGGLATARVDSYERAERLNAIGLGLLTRFQALADIADLNEAVAAHVQALTVAREGSPDWAGWQSNLGTALFHRYRALGRADDRDASIHAYRNALRVFRPDLWPRHTLMATTGLAELYIAERAWPEAADVLAGAVRAASALSQMQLLVGGRESWLARAGDLYRQAAYALARVGRLQDAVCILEQSRARTLSDALARDRLDLEPVRAADPEAYEMYCQAAAQLRHLESAERAGHLAAHGEAVPAIQDEVWDQARRARAELEHAVGRIRQLPGYEELFAEPTWSDVAAAVPDAASPPLAYLVTTPTGSLALVVHRRPPAESPAGVVVDAVWVDDLTATQLNDMLVSTAPGGAASGGYVLGELFRHDWLEEALDRTLPMLGRTLIAPLAAKLQQLGAQGVVLIPTGRLGLLPLHATEYLEAGQAVVLLERYDVAYAASARVMCLSRPAPVSARTSERVLIGVGNPLPSRKPLRFAQAEVEEAGRLLNGRAHLLVGHAARKHDLLALLPGSTHVHLACHGVFDLEQPLQSYLELADDERLTLRQILDDEHLRGVRLVVLSACRTGMSEFQRLPDEVLGLPAGCIRAGATSVVATLWDVDDLATALLMSRFYEYHLRGDRTTGIGPMPIVRALRMAQHWLRMVTCGELTESFESARQDGGSWAGLAGELLSQFSLADPDDQPFAAPYYWAAFAFFGQ